MEKLTIKILFTALVLLLAGCSSSEVELDKVPDKSAQALFVDARTSLDNGLYQKAIQINPNHIDAHNNLGVIFTQLGESQKAINCFEKAIKIEPENLTSHWLSMNTFPIMYEDFKEIDVYRKRFETNINNINQLLDLNSGYSKKQIIDALTSSTNFYLHYQEIHGGEL